jgi:UDP-2,3-diacylglucosamine pyrophosphatase LpxH
MTSPHDVFLARLKDVADVRLVARLDDAAAVGNTSKEYLHVFVPDLHLVSKKVRPRFAYGFDHAEMFSRVIDALLATWEDLEEAGHQMRVTQLGDFVDLWRESNNDITGIRHVLDSFPDIRDRFVRNAEDSIAANLILGNHDLDAGESRDFARARMAIHLPGVNRTMMATHGDRFDIGELLVADKLAAWAVWLFGRLAQPVTYPLKELRSMRDDQMPKDLTAKIQGDASLGEMASLSSSLPARFNVTRVEERDGRGEAHSLLQRAVETVKQLRHVVESDGKPIAPNLKVVVVGHSHHARLIEDKTAGLVLMDCGAWIEGHRIGDGPTRPNRQLGATCGSDLRIYQLD